MLVFSYDNNDAQTKNSNALAGMHRAIKENNIDEFYVYLSMLEGDGVFREALTRGVVVTLNLLHRRVNAVDSAAIRNKWMDVTAELLTWRGSNTSDRLFLDATRRIFSSALYHKKDALIRVCIEVDPTLLSKDISGERCLSILMRQTSDSALQDILVAHAASGSFSHADLVGAFLHKNAVIFKTIVSEAAETSIFSQSDDENRTVLHVCVQNISHQSRSDKLSCLATLINRAPETMCVIPDKNGNVPLHCCRKGSIAILLLRKNPASLFIKNHAGHTPIQTAILAKHTDAVMTMLSFCSEYLEKQEEVVTIQEVCVLAYNLRDWSLEEVRGKRKRDVDFGVVARINKLIKEVTEKLNVVGLTELMTPAAVSHLLPPERQAMGVKRPKVSADGMMFERVHLLIFSRPEPTRFCQHALKISDPDVRVHGAGHRKSAMPQKAAAAATSESLFLGRAFVEGGSALVTSGVNALEHKAYSRSRASSKK